MRPSLFEFAGGESAYLALAAAHHARCLQDPELNHPFSHPDQHPQHVERLASYWAEVMGGPPRYSGTCGDHSAVLQMHAGNGDMSDLGCRFVDCFVRAADDAGLPEDAEFRAAPDRLHAVGSGRGARVRATRSDCAGWLADAPMDMGRLAIRTGSRLIAPLPHPGEARPA